MRLNGTRTAGAAQLAVFAREGGSVQLASAFGARLLVLAGEPIREPVVGHGPFVMNSEGEISQALLDYREGRFGRIAR